MTIQRGIFSLALVVAVVFLGLPINSSHEKGAVLVDYAIKSDVQDKQESANVALASLVVSGMEGDFRIPSGINIYEAMRTVASSSVDFSFSALNHPDLGFFIESIGNRRNRGGLFWTLYVNGAYSDVGASNYVVKRGDVIEWRYEKL
jgi:hypothetical protein